jgi:hypothetical protein
VGVELGSNGSAGVPPAVALSVSTAGASVRRLHLASAAASVTSARELPTEAWTHVALVLRAEGSGEERGCVCGEVGGGRGVEVWVWV